MAEDLLRRRRPRHLAGRRDRGLEGALPGVLLEGSRFAGALTGISPGDVALLDIAVAGGVKMSTGVFVLYADAQSFTFATPQGHQFAGWITFSAERSGEATVVQTQVLLRAGDPLYELGMPVMHRMEDRFWAQTMIALGKRLGVADPAVQTRSVCLDPQRQWRRAGNVWQNSMARSVLQTVVPPLAAHARRRRSQGQPAAS